MLQHAFFPALSPSLLSLFIDLVVSAVVGIGVFTIYLNCSFRQVQQRLAMQIPEGRCIHVAASSWRVWALLMVTGALLLFSAALLRIFSDTGTLFTGETLEFVVTCIVATPMFALVPILLVNRSPKRLERRLGMAHQQQTARPRPQPKEAREAYSSNGKLCWF